MDSYLYDPTSLGETYHIDLNYTLQAWEDLGRYITQDTSKQSPDFLEILNGHLEY